MSAESKPGWLRNDEIGSFAESTIIQRKPQILDRLLKEEIFSHQVRESIVHFREEIASGTVKRLPSITPDAQIWNSCLEQWGMESWIHLPWFFAESYFYRRLLDITEYYDENSPHYRFDPFHSQKQEQIEKDLESLKETDWLFSTRQADTRFLGLLHAALWGNRADLSNQHVNLAHTRDEYHGAAHLVELIDDSDKVLTYFKTKTGTIAYFLDNVGRELFSDLALIHYLLSQHQATKVTIVAKPAPFFVSDALVSDVHHSLDELKNSGMEPGVTIVSELRQWLDDGSLVIMDHETLCEPYMYSEMNPEFHSWLGKYDLAIFKGDANYRRVVEDRHWRYETDIKSLTGYFRTDLILIRTLKSELMVGLPEGMGEQFDKTNPGWLIRGDYGLIQFIENRRHGDDL